MDKVSEEIKAEIKRLNFDKELSYRKIAIEIKDHFPDQDIGQIKDNIVRGVLRRTERYKKEHKPINKPIGVFSDVHIPFEHPNYLQFLKDTFKEYGVGQVVCVGDLVDNHAISNYKPEACAKSSYDELDMAIEQVAKYTKAFPKVRMAKGNHDLRPVRQAATVGMGERFLKPFNELLKIPKTWTFEDEFIIDNVLYRHEGCGGKNGALNTALVERMSMVVGHQHTFGGCDYSANPRNLIFGMNVGCGIHISQYAFVYGKKAKYRPTLGCGIVYNDSHATFVPMGKEYFSSNEEVDNG